jgi:hypothetical protein
LEPTQLLGHRNQLAPKRLPVARRSSHVSHVDHLEASFARLARGLPGRVGIAFAPLGGGSIRPLGPLQVAHAWSTMKVPVLVTLMRHLEGRGRTLSPGSLGEATLAIEQSDNAAINSLFAQLEAGEGGGVVAASRAIQDVLRVAGDETTQVNTRPNDDGWSTFGQTEWSASGEVSFTRSLARGCLLSVANTETVLGLMRNVTPSQRWGVGAAGFRSDVSLAFKGGWGPEPPNGSYVVRQSAVVESGSQGCVLAIIAAPSATGEVSFDEGTQMVTEIATWARIHLTHGRKHGATA